MEELAIARPNHARASSYKNKGLLRLARCAHPYLIIDLHGSRSQDFTVAVGTAPAHRAGRAQPMIEYISARLAGLLGCDVLVDPPGFRANNPSTVTAHCWSALGIPTLQIEISRAFRRPRHDPAAYAMLFTAFSTLIGELCSHPVAAQ